MADLTLTNAQGWTAELFNGLTDTSFSLFVDACQPRLMASLCLTDIPDTDVWRQLVAGYCAAVFKDNTSGNIQMKEVRSFRVTFKQFDALGDFAKKYAPILAQFFNCGSLTATRLPAFHDDDWPDGLRMSELLPDWPL